METKVCSKCGETKPLSEFPLASYTPKSGIRGRRADCNKGLGHFRDNINTLSNAISYINGVPS